MPGGLGDPRGMCASQSPMTCGTTGVCSGSGTCARYDATTECMTSCDALGTSIVHTFCDGVGTCGGLAIPEPCLPALMCAAGVCTTP